MSEIIDYCVAGAQLVQQGIVTQQVTVQGDLKSGAVALAAKMPQSRAGTVSHLRVYVISHSGGPTTVKLVKSQGIQPFPGLEVSFDDGQSGLFENTSISIPFSVDDDLRIVLERDSTSDSTELSYVSVKIEFD